MSLLSRDDFVAVLAPARATLLRAGRGGPAPCGASDCEGGWNGAADALQGLMREGGARRGGLTVVLSSHFAHFLLVPWSDAIGSPAELETFTRIGFEDIYGPIAAGWALRISPEAAGRPRVAVAIEQALLDRLQTVAQGAGMRLASVQPHLMAAYNRLQPRLARDNFVFAVAEPGRCSILLARAGQWLSVRSNASADSERAVAALLERECELNGVGDPAAGPVPAVYVHAAGRTAVAWPAVEGIAPQALALGGADAWQDMALAAA
ncbi:hypothetical protein SAMN05421829_12021 [Aromatoleum tolulyticum]|uniref:Uncharacterized protein n=1 Tax=Aromatoleum tolulyticum TaxID=34027 RepID=A0A1N7BWP0_9RHOO|nr:hypothetical protein [Aromatoleum tolulyticum]SIR55759.1 hypothetical protein SAMN05421829_12021 [Aromatoleum tolulyticum]